MNRCLIQTREPARVVAMLLDDVGKYKGRLGKGKVASSSSSSSAS